MLDALDPPVGAGISEPAVQIAAQGLDEDVVDQRAFARAGNAGDADEQAERDLDVDVLQIVVRGAADDERLPSPARRRWRESRSAACRKGIGR